MASEPGRVVAGVDEAGLGPLVGPLAIGYSAFRLPRAGACPWRLLRRLVSADPADDAQALVVADSKKVFARNPRGRARLEATALVFLALLDRDGLPPESALSILRGPLGPQASALARHPWYERLAPLPREHERATLELRAARLAREMRAQALEPLEAGVRIVPAGELNDSYAVTSNKALTVWEKTLEVLRYLWHRLGAEAPHVTVDLLGGRVYYGPLLARGFPEARVSWSREESGHACYRLEERAPREGGAPRRMRLDFRARGEEHSFPVALASCLAKYARETVMDAFNAYFAALDPTLRPTAGYRGDGTRWMREAVGALERAGLARTVLVRER